MLQGLSQVVSKWQRSPNSQHCRDESHKFFQAKGAAACLMRRLVALTRLRAQLRLHQHVYEATLGLVQALAACFAEDMHAGLFTYELRPLLHQVCTHLLARDGRHEICVALKGGVSVLSVQWC